MIALSIGGMKCLWPKIVKLGYIHLMVPYVQSMTSQDGIACHFIGLNRLAGRIWGTDWLWSGCGTVVVLLLYNLV